MKPTDVIKYLHHYKGCPFRYEKEWTYQDIKYKHVVLSNVDTLIWPNEMTVFEGTCNGEPIEECCISFNNFDGFRLIMTHPKRLTAEQMQKLRLLRGKQAEQTIYCFEQFIDIFGWIDGGIAIDAFPDRKQNKGSIPSILTTEKVKEKRREYQKKYFDSNYIKNQCR